MTYRLKTVVRYTEKIAKLSPQHSVPPIKKNKQENIDEAERTVKALREERNVTNLVNYAQAVHNLAQYFINEKVEETKFIRKVIAGYVDNLRSNYKFLQDVGKLKEVVGASNPEEAEFLQEEKVGDFLDSKEFCDLKKYLHDTLRDDKQDHSFLCMKKAKILETLLMKLEGQATMDGVKEVLQEFYSGKDKGNTDHESDYHILNTGQISTRFFSALGFGGRTTISYIDDLTKSIHFDPVRDPEIAAMVNLRLKAHIASVLQENDTQEQLKAM